MYVNGFWLGVLMTIVVEIVLIIIASFVKAHQEENEEPTEEEIAFAEAFNAFCEEFKKHDKDK